MYELTARFKKIGDIPIKPVLILWILILITFSPAFRADYVAFDEIAEIIENPEMYKPISAETLIETFGSRSAGNQYAPLPVLTFQLENHFSGELNPVLSHSINIFLHMMVVTGVFYFSVLLSGNLVASIICAMFFAIHPMQVESVVWALERRNLLFGFFFFLSMASYTYGLEKTSKWNSVLTFAAMILCGLSKGLAFLLPFSFLTVDWAKKRPIKLSLLKEKWIYFISASIFFYIALTASRGNMNISHEGGSALNWINSMYAIPWYLAKALLPFNLSPIYEITPSTVGIFRFAPAYFALSISIWYFFLRKSEYFTAGLAFFFINIFPLSGLIRVGFPFYVACHFMYVAIWGLIFPIAIAISKSFFQPRKTRLIITALTIVVALLSFVSNSDSHHWNNTTSLFSRVLETNPESRFALFQLGVEKTKRFKFNEAETLLQRLIDLYPDLHLGYYGLADLKFNQKLYNRSLELFDKAISLEDQLPQYFFGRAKTCFKLKLWNKAITDFSSYLKSFPENVQAMAFRAQAFIQIGNLQAARKDLTEVLKQKENYLTRIALTKTLLNLGDFYGFRKSLFEMLINDPKHFIFGIIGTIKKYSDPLEGKLLAEWFPYKILVLKAIQSQ